MYIFKYYYKLLTYSIELLYSFRNSCLSSPNYLSSFVKGKLLLVDVDSLCWYIVLQEAYEKSISTFVQCYDHKDVQLSYFKSTFKLENEIS